MNPQDNNYGYLPIDTEEKKKKFGPKLRIDEYKDGGSQWDSVADGDVFHDLVIYRRPLVPPSEDWELVGLDEVIQEGDEFFCTIKNGWIRAVDMFGKKVSEVVHPSIDVACYRRRKSKPQGERVIDWTKDALEVCREVAAHGDCHCTDAKKNCAYCLACKVSDANPIQKSDLEQSFTKYWYRDESSERILVTEETAFKIFTAGYEAGKGAK